MPLHFKLEDSRPICITSCVLVGIDLEHGAADPHPEVGIHHAAEEGAEITDVVFVRAPSNLLHFRLGFSRENREGNGPEAESFKCRLRIEFNGETVIELQVHGSINWAYEHLAISSVRRRKKPLRLLTNLGLLAGALGSLHFWARYLARDAYTHEPWLLSPAHLNLATSFIIGFLGLQVAHFLVVAKSLRGLRSIRDYPELHLARPLSAALLSKPAKVLMPMVFVAAMGYVAWNWTVPLKGDLIGGHGYFRQSANEVWIDESARVPTPRRVRIHDVEELRIGCVSRRDVSTLPALGELELDHPDALAFWNRTVRPAYWPFAFAMADQDPSTDLFPVRELLASRDIPHGEEIQAAACGESQGSPVVEFTKEGDLHVVRVRKKAFYANHHLQTLFGRAKELVDSHTLQELVDESPSLIEKLSRNFESEQPFQDRRMPRKALLDRHRNLLLGNGKKGHALGHGIHRVEPRRAVAEIQVLRAYLALIERQGGEMLSGTDIKALLEVAKHALSSQPGLGRLDKSIVLTYSMFLLDIERRYILEANGAIQDSLERVIDRAGGEFYALVLEAHARTDTLLNQRLPPATRKQRERFFFDRREAIVDSVDARERVETLLANARDSRERQYLASLLS